MHCNFVCSLQFVRCHNKDIQSVSQSVSQFVGPPTQLFDIIRFCLTLTVYTACSYKLLLSLTHKCRQGAP